MSLASVGSQALMAFETVAPIDANSQPVDFVSEKLSNDKEHIHPTGIRGTRSRHKERTRDGLQRVGGPITLEPSPSELDFILPFILGAAEVPVDTFNLAETLPELIIGVRRVVKEFTYTGCKIVRAVFSGSEGSPLQLALDVVGKTSADAVVGTVVYPTPDSDDMYVFTDSVLTVLAGAREMSDFELIIENVHEEDRYTNSVTRTDVPIIDRNVFLNITVPYDATNEDLHDQAVAGAAGSLVFTNGARSITFTMANIKFPPRDPGVADRGEIPLELAGTCLQSGATKELVVVNDVTP